MPDFMTHVMYTLLLAGAFASFSLAMDIDHFTLCNPRALATAAVDPQKGSEMLTELNQTNCRGFFHHWRTGLVLLSLFLAWAFHMFLDYMVRPTIQQPNLPW